MKAHVSWWLVLFVLVTGGATPARGALPDGLAATPLAERVPGPGSTLFEDVDLPPAGINTKPFVPSPELRELIRQSPLDTLEDSYEGVCIGDYDQDGRPDFFVAHPYGAHRLYRNLGGFRFEDVTEKAGLTDPDLAGAGPSFVDIDNDGDLDLFVCGIMTANRLFINQGDGTFVERAKEFGLDLVKRSVVMAFADIDLDGDLDGYLVATGARTDEMPDQVRFKYRFWRGRAVIPDEYVEKVDVVMHPDEGPKFVEAGQRDHLFLNNGDGTFTDISRKAGLFGGYKGLAATWWDFDNNGYPDLYVSNDFWGGDQMFRNRGNDTFEEVAGVLFPYVPWFSMGADCADINNDGWLDLFATDMSGSTRYKRKMGMGDMEKQNWFLETSFPRQYMRNCLFLNTGTLRFMEVAHMLGLSNTDWTWSVKFGDLDNDGRIDVYVTNGMAKDLNNSDYANEVNQLKTQEEKDRFWQEKGIKRDTNFAFRNLGDLRFESVGPAWGLDQTGYSAGAAYGDLDGDGDLDIVVTGTGKPLTLYRNGSTKNHLITLRLKGRQSNRYGLGSMVRVETSAGLQIRYLNSSQGYTSANDPVIHFGLGDAKRVDRLEIRWPSGHVQTFVDLPADRAYTATEPAGAGPGPKPPHRERTLFVAQPWLKSVRHQENDYNDFADQPLLPWKLSRLGPGMAWGDVNGDHHADVYVSGAKGQAGSLLLSQGLGRFVPAPQPAFEADADHEDLGALFLDVDGDGDLDLYVVSGGADVHANPGLLRDRLYLNNGQGRFSTATDRLPDLHDSGSVVAGADFDRDGDLDLFVGARFLPGRYPETPESRLLENRDGRFVDVTDTRAPGLRQSGLVTSALWSDADGDGWIDLMVTHDWGPVRCWGNRNGRLEDRTADAGLEARRGFWNGIAGGDLDGDGDIDYVVTNLGLNTKYSASMDAPLKAYYGEFCESGQARFVEASYDNGELYPIRGRSCTTHAMPALAELFPTYHEFASSTLAKIYTPTKLDRAVQVSVNTLESGVLRNDGGHFTFQPLPRLAQVSPGYGVAVADINADGAADIYLVQNSYSPQRETGHMAGGLSQLLTGRGDGTFDPVPPRLSGLVVSTDAKALAAVDMNGDGWIDLAATSNDGPLHTFRNQGRSGNQPVMVRLQGSAGNPAAVGARVRLTLNSGRRQTAEVYAGGGYLSQSDPALFFGRKPDERIAEVTVVWPNGKTESRHPDGAATRLVFRQPQG